MAEADPVPAPAAAPRKPGGKKKIIAIVGAFVVLEAAGIFIALKMFGGGPSIADAHAVAASQPHDDDLLSSAEIEIAQFRAPNEKTGQLFVYDLKVAAVVAADRKEELEQLVARVSTKITDRLIRVIRRAEPGQLREEDLGSLRRQIKYELDKLFQDDTIVREVLIPYFQKYRSDL
jgi:flagellar basal body-associated protein FliL